DKLTHASTAGIQQHIAESVKFIQTQGDDVENGRGGNVFKAETLAVCAQDQIVVNPAQVLPRTNFLQERLQIVIVTKKGVKAMINRRRGAIRKGHLPPGGLAAEVGV